MQRIVQGCLKQQGNKIIRSKAEMSIDKTVRH